MPINIFKEITKVPRPSGSEEKMVEYLKKFAQKNNIFFESDNFNNVLLKKKTADVPALILQAHTDMVCVKELDSKINFQTDPLKLIEKEGYIKADGTSLGADNGLGVALALKILQEDFPMNLEVVLTSEEETTMAGAFNFDVSKLSSKYMINLDGSDNNVINISSASGTDIGFKFEKFQRLSLNQIQQSFLDEPLNTFSIEISGLIGGHSGIDIDKNRGHAFKTAIDFFDALEEYYFLDFNAKAKSNEIPTYFKGVFATTKSLEQANQIVKKVFDETYISTHAPKLSINVKRVNLPVEPSKSEAIMFSDSVLEFLKKVKFGVLKEDFENDVVLSANLYEINLKEGFASLSLRAADENQRKYHISKLESLCKAYNVKMSQSNFLPGFSVSKDNKFVKYVAKAAKAVFKQDAKLVKIHAGLECGIFAEKIEGLNVCAIGPQIEFLHSTKERLNIESTQKTYDWLKLIVKNFR